MRRQLGSRFWAFTRALPLAMVTRSRRQNLRRLPCQIPKFWIHFGMLLSSNTCCKHPVQRWFSYRCKMSGNVLEADIIVIGGGAAGCILMSEPIRKWTLFSFGIEGGQKFNLRSGNRSRRSSRISSRRYRQASVFLPGWNQTLPMEGLNGRTSDWTTGMILGGGSSINGLYYAADQMLCMDAGKMFPEAPTGASITSSRPLQPLRAIMDWQSHRELVEKTVSSMYYKHDHITDHFTSAPSGHTISVPRISDGRRL